MKNIQVIDGANNTAYDIYSVEDETFYMIFPSEGQNIEFIEDVFQRIGEDSFGKDHEKIWEKPVNKHEVNGIHGTLFYELSEKKEYYPSKKESDLNASARPWEHS
ncbi:hypothetical protein [Pseudemcibacter aquimaris]|uniref:hypothetical protein n=1 Tax=Pseudemcibacter aquimaris TaxID=2857064 RepID=UPI0020133A61|nr:hypothetical protein [Pseudemcibacter aquimaris]MCC3861091.1 hypothetical protein [Pseudemcibacter aquimaris]WDU59909.1 hypothetical protein KW060_06525 [Pseudemcibacter aquimaris]